jgi:hypothetical protein
MRGQDDEDAGRRRGNWYGTRRRRDGSDTGRLAARLAPLEERTPAPAGRNGTGPDDTIKVEVGDPGPSGGLPDEGDEHGVFYMPPVVTVTVSLFPAYTLFVAFLIALG